MSPKTSWVLQAEVAPRLKASIHNGVQCVGAEDTAELLQDAVALAARLMENNERAGKEASPGNIAYYTTGHIRSGRRSTGSSVVDVMASGTQLAGRSRLHSLEDIVACDTEAGGEIFTLGDVLSRDNEDAAMCVARQLDWEAFCAGLPDRERAVVEFIAQGRTLREAGRKLNLSDSTMQTCKRHLAEAILAFMGHDVLAEAQRPPHWRRDLDATRERIACRRERQAA